MNKYEAYSVRTGPKVSCPAGHTLPCGAKVNYFLEAHVSRKGAMIERLAAQIEYPDGVYGPHYITFFPEVGRQCENMGGDIPTYVAHTVSEWRKP